MEQTRSYHDVMRREMHEPAEVVEAREVGPTAGSYLIPAAVLVLFLIGGILLLGSVPASRQVGPDIEPSAVTTPAPAPTIPR